MNHLLDHWKELNIDKEIIETFQNIPRENFVLNQNKHNAYIDYPLPTIKGQTISQPTTIAIMLNSLNLKKDDKVLEIGSGTGYVCALLSKIVNKVYGIEIVPELVSLSKINLKKLNIKNVDILLGDGYDGLLEYSPYDKIIVSAAAKKISRDWISQLKNNGILVAPVGEGTQKMMKITKNKYLKQENLGDFMFVPLIKQ